MSESQEQRRLIAAVTLTMPSRKIGSNWQAGKVVKAKQEVPTRGLDQTYIDQWVKSGSAFWEGSVPQLRDVKALRTDDEKVNVSAVKKGNTEDNPLDDGIDLVAGDADPALAQKLEEIATEQAADDVEDDNSEPEPKNVEVNAGDGDPALASKLDEIAAEQAGEGVEDDNSEPEPKAVEVNAETGEVTETGGEMEFDDEEADAQVS